MGALVGCYPLRVTWESGSRYLEPKPACKMGQKLPESLGEHLRDMCLRWNLIQ